jgi:hypothetical protein
MDRGFIKLSEVINTEPAFNGLRKNIKDFELIDSFHQIFPDLEKVAKPIKIDRKTLYLKVENSVWRSELKFGSNVIVEKINTFFKEERIKYIKFL